MPATPAFLTAFDLDSESGSYGKYNFEDTTDYATLGINPANVKGWFVINFPNNQSYSGSSTSPDILPNASVFNNVISVPQDVNGNWLQGTYTFTYFIEVSGGVLTGTYSKTITYKYCSDFLFKTKEEGCLTEDVDCFKYQITTTDKTKYGTPDVLTRVLTLYVPPILVTEGKASNQTTNAASLVYTFGYTGGYSANLNTYVEYGTTPVIVKGRIKSNIDISVKCSQNICKIIACYAEQLAKLKNQISRRVVNAAMDNVLVNNVALSSFYLWQYKEAGKCGNTILATEAFEQLQRLLNCNCGCSDGKNDVELVNPDFSTAATQIFTFIATNPLVVNTNTVGNNTTVTYSLSQSFIDNITAIGSAISTIQGQVSTLQTAVTTLQSQVATLQDNELNQVVYETGALAIPATNTWTTTASYTALLNTLEVGSELELNANFYFVNSNDGRDLRIRINTVEVIAFNDASVKAMVGVFMSAKLKLQVLTATTASYQATLSIVNTNLVEQFKTILSPSFGTFTINDIATLSNSIDAQAKHTAGGTLAQLNANVKQFNKV
jgi:hypothetical protein